MISFVVISRAEDKTQLLHMLQTLPQGSEVCILWNQKGKKEKLGPVEECEQDGLNIRQRMWTYEGDFCFATARNHSQEMATNDWCFWIDSDDRLLPFQHHLILQIPEAIEAGYGAIYCGCTYPQPEFASNGGGMSYAAQRQCRIYRKSAGAKWYGRVHEQVLPSIIANGYQVKHSPIMVYHEGYNTTMEVLYRKALRNVQGLTKQCAEMSTDSPQYGFFEQMLQTALSTKLKLEREEL